MSDRDGRRRAVTRLLGRRRPSVAFVLCVEQGRLEQPAVLLARSIRRWTGRFADSRIRAYRPREGPPLSAPTLRAFEELDVELAEEPLNRDHAFYPMANKVYAAAHAEASMREHLVVVTDSDTVFLNAPRALVLPDGRDVGVRPVGDVGKGSRGPRHKNEPYWQRLYELAGVTSPPWVKTMRTRVRVRGYWSSGLIVARRSAGVFAEWLELLRLMFEHEHVPRSGRVNNMDQLALAGVLSRRPRRLHQLGGRYNYVIPLRSEYRPHKRTIDLDRLVHVHYTRWFNRPGFLALLDPPLDRTTPQYRWLERFLPFEPTIHEPLHGSEPPHLADRDGRRRLREDFGTRGPRYSLQDAPPGHRHG